MSARCYLYVPGDRPEMLAKAASRGADALIVDLEDAVPVARKEEARAIVAAWLAARPAGGPAVWVRVNAGAAQADDLAICDPTHIDGIVVPKVDAPAQVAAAVATGAPVCALIETATGVLDAPAIARAPGVVRLALGEADLAADLGMSPSPDGREWLAIRTRIVLASAAAGIEPPVGPVATDINDATALRATTDAIRRMGFGARAAIHPAQVSSITEIFTPTPEEIAAASELLDASRSAGGGAFRTGERMVDEAVLRSARRTLERAGITSESVEGMRETLRPGGF